ncbi:MAG: polysaccharide deacetylase family protein [Roseobacter sp.]
MQISWQPLRNELALWRRDNRSVAFWWRDDDAIKPTPALERLSNASVTAGMPVHIAVIPAAATQALADHVAEQAHLVPMVHGWAHANHAPDTAKKAEFGSPREAAASELQRGMDRLSQLFTDQLVPVFVPPWNRMDRGFLPLLAATGFCAVSTFGRAPKDQILPFINSHLDPVDWRGTRGLHDPDLLISRAVTELQARRTDPTPDDEPFGFLTHHLVHDDQIWDFCAGFIAEMLDGAAKPLQLDHHLETTHEPT